jgi:predicted protein tyrosine phosphatase
MSKYDDHDEANERTNVLFVCSRNLWRSPTAEQLFRHYPQLSVRSAGVAASARRKLNERDVLWAHVIVVMESEHKRRVVSDFGRALGGRLIHVLDIPDDYRFMDPELVSMLEASVPPLLGLA